MSKKRVKNGQFAGFRLINESNLEKQKRESKAAIAIPTKQVPIFDRIAPTGQNCKGGDIDSCQNYAWCALCIDPTRARTAINSVPVVVGVEEVLDTQEFLARLPKQERILLKSN